MDRLHGFYSWQELFFTYLTIVGDEERCYIYKNK